MKLTVWAPNEWILPRMSIKQVALRSLHLDQIGVAEEGGEGTGFSRAPCCQHQGWLFIPTTNQRIPGFLYSLHFCGTLELFGVWALRPIAPDEWVWTVWPCSPPSEPQLIGPEVLTQKQQISRQFYGIVCLQEFCINQGEGIGQGPLLGIGAERLS